MHYHQIQPHPMLAPFVRCYWAVRVDSPVLPRHDHGVIPGGYVDLVFNVGDPVYMKDSGGIFAAQAKGVVIGPFDRFLSFRVGGRFDFFGVRFRLGRFPFLSNFPLGETRNRAVPLDAVWVEASLKAEIQSLEISLAQVSGMTARIARVEQFLMKVFRRLKEPDPIVVQALGLIEASKGQISVDTVASALAVSGRQLERKFIQHVGLSPKTFCRVTRFHHVKSLLESAREPSGCDLAYAGGYYDQTHLIREFRLFTGQTPTRYERAQPVGFFLYD